MARLNLMISCAALAYAVSAATVASAQTASSEASAQEAQKAERDDTEIVVTATKRAERLFDVAVSVAALGTETIEQRGFTSSEDYLRRIPGVSQTGQDGRQNIIIRGLNTGGESARNLFAGTTTGTYFGETPMSASAGLGGGSANDLKLIDIERVEVLRGPQGTAFGASSLGGTVRVIPAAPNLSKLEGRVAAEYSRTSGYGADNTSVSGFINVPLMEDRLALRVVGYRVADSGYYQNITGSDPAYRAAVITPYGAEDYAIDLGRMGDRVVVGTRISLLVAPTDDLRLTLSYVNQSSEQDGPTGSNLSGYRQAFVIYPSDDGLGRRKPYETLDTDTEVLNATLEYDLGWSDLTATYSRVNTSSTQGGGFYFLPSPWSGQSEFKQDVGEVRLATKFEGSINLLGGLYYDRSESTNDGRFYWSGDIALDPFNFLPGPFLDPANGLMGRREDGRKLTQVAAFGEITWEPIEHVSITGGARVYNYKHKYTEFTIGQFYGADGTDYHLSQDVSDKSFRASVSYKPNDDVHLYAGWAQGFRLGRPNPGLPSSCDIAPADGNIDGTNLPLVDTNILKSDTVNSYEVGGKFRFFDRRLRVNASVFRVDWKDIPVFIPALQCGLGTFINAPSARSEGFELESSFLVTDAFRLELSGSYTNARYTSELAVAGVVRGARLADTPKYQLNLGGEYRFEVENRKVFLRADASYISKFGVIGAQDPAGDYTLVDLTAGIDLSPALSLTLFAKNVTGEDAFTISGATPLNERLRPRTVGVRVGYNF